MRRSPSEIVHVVMVVVVVVVIVGGVVMVVVVVSVDADRGRYSWLSMIVA